MLPHAILATVPRSPVARTTRPPQFFARIWRAHEFVCWVLPCAFRLERVRFKILCHPVEPQLLAFTAAEWPALSALARNSELRPGLA